MAKRDISLNLSSFIRVMAPSACSDANFGMFIASEQRKFGSPIPYIPFSLIPTIYDFPAFFAKHAAIFVGLLFTEELTVLIPR